MKLGTGWLASAQMSITASCITCFQRAGAQTCHKACSDLLGVYPSPAPTYPPPEGAGKGISCPLAAEGKHTASHGKQSLAQPIFTVAPAPRGSVGEVDPAIPGG